MKFQTPDNIYADVSLKHISLLDQITMSDPHVLDEVENWIETHSCLDGGMVVMRPLRVVENIDMITKILLNARFSFAFIKLVGDAAKQGFEVIRFHSDGKEVEGANTFTIS